MLLSLIIPCYNTGARIKALLALIAAQADDALEVIVINDGSTDDTARFIREFINESSSVCKVILEETVNRGAAKARETGLHLASGDFVFFCDSDDILQPNFISTFQGYLKAYPDMDLMLFSSEICVDDDGKLNHVSSKVCYPHLLEFANGSQLLTYNLTQDIYTSAVWTYIFKRGLLKSLNVFFTPRHAHEDHLFTLQVFLNASFVIATPELIYTQLLRKGSLTNSAKSVSYIIDRIEAYNEAKDYLKRESFSSYVLYDVWSYKSIFWLIKSNIRLLSGIILTKSGIVFLITSLPYLSRLMGQKMRKLFSYNLF